MVAAGKSGGARFWAEISHTGRQVVSEINPAPLAPSMVDVEVMRGIGYTFSPPRAMTTAQIHHAIGQFAQTAELAKRAGFDGVELHGAHGYLISQFLSPRTNLRKDEWGGNIGNRARFLVEVLAAVRAAVGPEFPVGLKLNATDFQKGGFTNAECIEVVRRLNSTSLDLLELSGGSLEQPKMMGVALKDEGEDGLMASSCRSEAYFLGFAADIRKVATMPIMVTGGFRTLRGMEDALHGGQLDLVGIGRPMLVDPDVPRKLLSGEMQEAPKPEAHLEMFHHMPWLNMQIERMGDGLEPDPTMDGADAAACFVALESANLETLLGARAALGVA
ncbi:hypothetical protein AQZ50_15715 [Novosphingobium sp. Fuku2-ISO-50]|nr:hypothetical protein AQZ50_15715 [Novosphingobium sp. Fuku2-ISO-50]